MPKFRITIRIDFLSEKFSSKEYDWLKNIGEESLERIKNSFWSEALIETAKFSIHEVGRKRAIEREKK